MRGYSCSVSGEYPPARALQASSWSQAGELPAGSERGAGGRGGSAETQQMPWDRVLQPRACRDQGAQLWLRWGSQRTSGLASAAVLGEDR